MRVATAHHTRLISQTTPITQPTAIAISPFAPPYAVYLPIVSYQVVPPHASVVRQQYDVTAETYNMYLPIILLTTPTPTPRTFATLGIHLGNRPAIAWNDLPGTDEPFDFLARLDGTHGVAPATVVVLSNQVFHIERATTGQCDITGARIARPHMFTYLKNASQWTTPDGTHTKILFRVTPSPGNFVDAVTDTNSHDLLLGDDTPQDRTYCAGQGQNGINGFESFRAPTDIVQEMNVIMELLNTEPEATGFLTDHVYFIPANEPNLEWYEEWYDQNTDPVYLSDPRVWRSMNNYFMNIYIQPRHDGVRILTPVMAPGLYAERWSLGCDEVLIGEQKYPGYTYMRAVYEQANNNGYAWNNYWNEGKEEWSKIDPCPSEPDENAPFSHHIFQFFPDWLQSAIRTSPDPAFITEGDLHSPHQHVGSNPIRCKDADPQRTVTSLRRFVEQETAVGIGGADYVALWLLTEDLLEEPPYTTCLALDETMQPSREAQWHQAYLVDGTPCNWFTSLWQ